MLAAIAAEDCSILIQNYLPYSAKRCTINLRRKNEWFSYSPQRLHSQHDSNHSRSSQSLEWSLHCRSFALYSIRNLPIHCCFLSVPWVFPRHLPSINIGESLFSVSRDFSRRLQSINIQAKVRFLVLYFVSRGLLCYRYKTLN